MTKSEPPGIGFYWSLPMMIGFCLNILPWIIKLQELVGLRLYHIEIGYN